MAKTENFDMNKAIEGFFGAFSMDTKALETAVKNTSDFNVKLNKIALDAAKKNAEISSAWTAETLKKIEGTNKGQKEAADYATVASEFASTQANAVPEKVAAYAEVAKKAQLDALELFVAVGKDVQAEVVAATKAA